MMYIDINRKKGMIAAGTLKNYIQPIKLFCDMHDLNAINWRRISRALPKSKRASDIAWLHGYDTLVYEFISGRKINYR